MSKEEILEEWLRQTDQTYINKGHKMVILNAMEEYAKYQVSKLPIHGVSCIALDDLKKQLEIEKEDKERNKDNMFISTFQDGKIDATKKAIDILGGNCT
mgnify:CR=1 FL=1